MLYWGCVGLPLIVASAIVLGIHHTMGAAAARKASAIGVAWIALTGYLGWSGLLDAWAPPRMFFVWPQ